MEPNVQTDGLHSLLFCEGTQLENFKFFPGTRDGVTSSELRAAAEEAIRSAKASGLKHNSPKSGRPRSQL